MDGYLTLLDSLSSTLRQGWLELVSARQSMGASRINGVLLDLKVLSAATSLQVSKQNAESMGLQPSFILCKWVSSDIGECTSGEEKSREDTLQTKTDGQQLRNRNNSKLSGSEATDKTLPVLGGLVSPKLRSAQLSFETCVEKVGCSVEKVCNRGDNFFFQAKSFNALCYKLQIAAEWSLLGLSFSNFDVKVTYFHPGFGGFSLVVY